MTKREDCINLSMNEEVKMLSVRAIYDGKNIKLKEKVNIETPKEVIVTFLDPIDTEPTAADIQQMVQEGGALDFLNDEREDVYSDNDLKTSYK
ncbi:MAG: hypothetical protein KAT34_21035 [Candidatus Aminicenantes bacterium]|nr:hypothetical protein [Candidatus Aminicenantes bacterium]